MRYSLILEYLIDFCFITEFIIKIIAYGFFMDEHSYLTGKYFIYINLDNWNRLDFLIVFSSIVDMILIYHEVRALWILRILRLIKIIRSLRFISQNSNIKHVVKALLLSAGALANVTWVVFIFYLMYAILGMSLLKGKLGYCDINNYYKISI